MTIHLGIKISLDNWREKLDNDLQIGYAEVLFELARLEAYEPMFAWLRAHGTVASLHASTALEGGLVLNLATGNEEVRRTSLSLCRRTIDVAAAQGMPYVVVHPGSYHDWGIRDGRTFRIEPAVPVEVGNELATGAMLELSAYGKERGVTPLAETLPARDYVSYAPVDRARTIDVGFLSYKVLCAMGERGVGLCVDIGHLYAEAAVTGPDAMRDNGFGTVVAATRELAPYTRYVHLSTTTPPFNGADSHDGFLPEDYARGAVPTHEQLLTWLDLLACREVWAIPEPWGGADVHLANHRLLAAWLEQTP